MSKYLIESPHTKEQCLQALDDTLAKGPGVLAKYEFGCMAGDHRGWAIVDADNVNAVRNLIPDTLRSKSRIVPLTEFTPDQIRSFHQK